MRSITRKAENITIHNIQLFSQNCSKSIYRQYLKHYDVDCRALEGAKTSYCDKYIATLVYLIQNFSSNIYIVRENWQKLISAKSQTTSSVDLFP